MPGWFWKRSANNFPVNCSTKFCSWSGLSIRYFFLSKKRDSITIHLLYIYNMSWQKGAELLRSSIIVEVLCIYMCSHKKTLLLWSSIYYRSSVYMCPMKKKACIYVCPMKKRRILKELYYNRAPVACMYVCSMKKRRIIKELYYSRAPVSRSLIIGYDAKIMIIELLCMCMSYVVATISRLLKIIGLFCRISSLL